MACKPAPACRALLRELSTRFPVRRTSSDGICASPKHTQQNPTSDHEVGNAVDASHDPPHGVDCNVLVGMLVIARDPRIKYIIWNRRIWRSYDRPTVKAWHPQSYTGSNPHTKHMHVSIHANRRGDVTPWFDFSPPPTPPPEDDMFSEADRQMLKKVHDALFIQQGNVLDVVTAANRAAKGSEGRTDEVPEKRSLLGRIADHFGVQ